MGKKPMKFVNTYREPIFAKKTQPNEFMRVYSKTTPKT
jgi:hypothetical protein